MAIIDVVMYNGEEEIWDLHYHILKDSVDEFIVVEARTTFSGKPKELYFPKIQAKYERVKYFVIDENYSPGEILQAENSPNTQGADHWTNEFLQKESIKKALIHLKDDDVVFVGDCDEIWNPEHLIFLRNVQKPEKLKLQVYTYYLNNLSSEEFWGTIVSRYQWIKDECLNHIRTNAMKTLGEYGWHFTSLAKDLPRKLDDSYTKESYNTKEIQENLEKNIKENKDFLGRDFTYRTTELDWPQCLRDNREKYQHLLKT